ncbi:L,D-transpeptidase [Mesorhizobium sp. 1B3]|uniref:L,D-transpeptidase n=1 Tax=Mesorhizobium sp. 1B3 TaxID=3243599 RepID=UPI003D97C3EC
MKFRSLLMLGLGAALVLGPSSMASAQSALDVTKTAAMSVEKPKVKETAKGKNTQKNKNNAKANSKSQDKGKTSAKAKKNGPREAEVAKAQPENFFAAIFKPIRRVESAPESSQPQRKLTAKERRAAEKAAKARPEAPEIEQPVHAIVATGNNGELRSGMATQQNNDLFSALFGGTPRQQLLPETRALDAALAAKEARKQFKVKADFEPQEVAFSGYPRGTIVIDTSARYLYLVESSGTARRYAIAVGREGLEFKGKATVGDKQEWPRWIPTLDMQKREPKKYGQYKDGMPGGPDNPLGARAIYLYQGKKDTHIRIHGTNQPQTIGTNSSNGCFRMVNDHVKDLYSRVKMGTQVVVM